MTFLEFAARKLLGPPDYDSGEWLKWCCPFHADDNPSFGIRRTPDPTYRHRFKCFGCGEWGDAYDLLNVVYENDDFPRREERHDMLKNEYDQVYPSDPITNFAVGQKTAGDQLVALAGVAIAEQDAQTAAVLRAHEKKCKKRTCLVCHPPNGGWTKWPPILQDAYLDQRMKIEYPDWPQGILQRAS